MPVGIELQFGAAVFARQLSELEAKGKVLPESSGDYKVVQRIADRVIKAVEEGRGGGFQDHVSRFEWEVVVVEDKTPNAFVLPGGKIVVFTGLIKLLDRDEDLLAAVIGHEVAHALARHSTEKLSLGLAVTVVVNLALAALNFYQRRQIEQQQRQGGGRPGAYGGRGAGFPGVPVGMGGRQSPYGMGVRRSPYGIGRPQRGGGFGAPGLLNPQIISIFTNLFLQMPFSRRAEAEADLIGLKLMALAGYNANKAPETFRRLGAMEVGGKMQGMAGSDTARMVLQVQCTHPRSDSRVKMLEEELDMMKQHGDTALDRVMHPVSYWSL
ncbi:hypothetical protein WJX81_008114 [Elliptochloris bilobata]|uniref:Peptidase M48 domain-containing protein n=1 Tax=Elliptochloris bilobata TaxID=381761 RepID=A0AAW1RTA6_9CHLO